jgi:hypothetical protein
MGIIIIIIIIIIDFWVLKNWEFHGHPGQLSENQYKPYIIKLGYIQIFRKAIRFSDY